MSSLFTERRKNLIKSDLILYGMITLALIFPFIVLNLTDNILLTLFLAGMAALYLLSLNNSIDITFSSVGAEKITNKMKKNIKIRQFLNLLEELKIAANYKGEITPYLIKHDSINAMAISRKNKAAVAITTGALKKLNREELSGVVAHEIAHIINADSDVKLSAFIAVGVLGTYLEYISRIGGNSRKKGSNILLLIIALIFYALSILMFFAISRRRETLADVDAVRLTRNKYALIKALEKIAENEKMEVPESAASLFFANPLSPQLSTAFFGLFRTHPPLKERIEYLKRL